jgi:hypothetical protein
MDTAVQTIIKGDVIGISLRDAAQHGCCDMALRARAYTEVFTAIPQRYLDDLAVRIDFVGLLPVGEFVVAVFEVLIIGVECEGSIDRVEGRFVLAQLRQGIGDVIPGFRLFRINLQRVPIGRFGNCIFTLCSASR